MLFSPHSTYLVLGPQLLGMVVVRARKVGQLRGWLTKMAAVAGPKRRCVLSC